MGNFCSVPNDEGHVSKIKRKISIPKRELRNSFSECSPTKINLSPLKEKIQRESAVDQQLTGFQIISELGKGGQADVFEIKFTLSEMTLRKTSIEADKAYALKRIYKNYYVSKRESLELGKQIMRNPSCPFIVNGILSCEDEIYMYHVMEKAEGGDLTSLLQPETTKSSKFLNLGERGIKFIVAGVVLGLEYLHKNNIIYSDLKLENVLLGSDGYPLLTDFEMAVKGRCVKSSGYRGSLTYVAPQVFTQEEVDRGMDIWALGVFLYALAYGQTPYCNDEISHKQYVFECQKRENNYKLNTKIISKELSSLINELLKVNPRQRIGYCNFSQIKYHSFFKDFDWYRYERKELVNPLAKIIDSENRVSQVSLFNFENQLKLRRHSSPKKIRKESTETASSDFNFKLEEIKF